MRIGLLTAAEETFPKALIEKINGLGRDDLKAAMVVLEGTSFESSLPFDVIVDRGSSAVPYYRSAIDQAVAAGCTVVNDPGRRKAHDLFSALLLAKRWGLKVPRTTVLPNKHYRHEVSRHGLPHLAYPLDWQGIFDGIGAPAWMRPARDGGAANGVVVGSPSELLHVFDRTGNESWVLQEFFVDAVSLRAHVFGDDVSVIGFDRHERRCMTDPTTASISAIEKISRDSRTVTAALGLDMNVLEWAVKGDEIFLVDPFDPQGTLDYWMVTAEHFDHLVGMAMRFLVGIADRLEKATPELAVPDEVVKPKAKKSAPVKATNVSRKAAPAAEKSSSNGQKSTRKAATKPQATKKRSAESGR